ncbi:MAG TPA: MFS transporter [Gaiellaceae bacterium]|nr:MFS transporter [Gaiellaceae bacterium]
MGRLRESGRAFAHAFRSRELRRLQLAGAGSTLAVWAYSIAIAVYAYREDGANAVGIVLFVRWSLAAVFAPWLALLADRMSRRRVMLAVDVSRVGLVAGMTIVAAGGGPSLVTYTLAVVMSIISTGFAPAQAALLPTLAKTPEELTAANLALNTISSVGMFAGPAIGGVFLAFSGPWLVFALTGASYLWSAACVLGLPRDAAPEQPEESAIGAQLLGGFRAIGEDRHLQTVVGLIGAQMFVAGALEVVIVVDAIRVLDAGNAGVGWLNTALGVGGLGGGLVGIVLAARKRLASDFRLGLAVFGAGLALLAASTSFGAALVLFAVMGIGSTLVDVTGMTLLQRSAPSHVVGRVFGVLQSLMLATVAVGSLVTPLLVSALGPRETFVAIGLLLPALAAVTWRAVSAIDASARIPTEPLELLRAISIFAPLPEAVLERLAAAASEVRVMPDATVFAQGDSGDRFYVVAEGTARVVADGAEKARPSAGDFFGEIALLRDVPRTATVTAVDALRLYALERDAFLAAVTGHATSREAADGVVAARLPAGAAL